MQKLLFFNNHLRKIKPQYYYIAILIIIAVLSIVFKINLINNEVFENGRGDSSQRLLLANDFFHNWHLWLTSKMWVNMWPPGQFIILGALYAILAKFHLINFLHWTQASLYVPVVLFAFCIVLMFFIAKKEGGYKPALYSIIIFSLLNGLNQLSLSGLVEIYAVFFTALTIFLLYVYDEKRKQGYLFLAAFSLLWGSICRMEVLLLAPVFIVYLLSRTCKRNILYFGLIAVSFYLVKYSLLFAGIVNMPIRHDNIAKELYYFGSLSIFGRIVKLFLFLRSYALAFPLVLFFVGLWQAVFNLKKNFRALSFSVAATYFLIIAFLILLGKIGAFSRYQAIAVFCFIPTIAMGFDNIEKFVRKYIKQPISTLTVVIIVILFLLPQVNQMRTQGSRGNRPGARIVECKKWLQANLKPTDVVFFDFLNFWDQFLHAESENLSNQRIAWSYAFHPPSSTFDPLKYNKLSDLPEGAAIDFVLHQKPKYLVLASEKQYDKLKKLKLDAKHVRASFIRKFIHQDQKGMYWLKVKERRLLVKKFSNRDYNIFEVKYE